MPEDYGMTSVTNQQDKLIADNHPLVELPATISSGAGVVKRGTVLGRITEGGKYKPYNSLATDGSQVPRAVSTIDVDATATNEPTSVYVHGVFNKNALIGCDDAAILKLQEFSIYVKEVR